MLGPVQERYSKMLLNIIMVMVKEKGKQPQNQMGQEILTSILAPTQKIHAGFLEKILIREKNSLNLSQKDMMTGGKRNTIDNKKFPCKR